MRSELEGGKRDVHKAGSDFVKVDRRGKGLSHLLGCVLGGVQGDAVRNRVQGGWRPT